MHTHIENSLFSTKFSRMKGTCRTRESIEHNQETVEGKQKVQHHNNVPIDHHNCSSQL